MDFATEKKKCSILQKQSEKKSAQKEIVVIHLIPSHLKIDFILFFFAGAAAAGGGAFTSFIPTFHAHAIVQIMKIEQKS